MLSIHYRQFVVRRMGNILSVNNLCKFIKIQPFFCYCLLSAAATPGGQSKRNKIKRLYFDEFT